MYANTGIVNKAGPNPKKPLSNPPINITNIVINMKSSAGKFTKKNPRYYETNLIYTILNILFPIMFFFKS